MPRDDARWIFSRGHIAMPTSQIPSQNRYASTTLEPTVFVSPGFLFIVDLESNRFVEVNQAYCELTGLSRDELIGHQPVERQIISAETNEWVLQTVEKQGRIDQREATVRHSSGEQRTVIFTAEKTVVNNRRFLACTGVDITHRKREERKRDQTRELLQRLVDNIPIMIVKWDAQLKRFELNRHATEVLGWTNQDANDGIDFMEKVYPYPEYRSQVARFMQSLIPEWRELEVTAKDGRKIPSSWANIRLSDDTMVGIGIDLTERKQAEADPSHGMLAIALA